METLDPPRPNTDPEEPAGSAAPAAARAPEGAPTDKSDGDTSGGERTNKESAESDLHLLVRRLCDLVMMPPGQLAPQERSLIDTVLTLMIQRLDFGLRQRLARRLSQMSEGPIALTMALANDDIEVAAPLLEEGMGLQNSELVQIIKDATEAHRERIAARRALSSAVTDALVEKALEFEEPAVLLQLLNNEGASLSHEAMEVLGDLSSGFPQLQAPLLSRPEMTPRLAHSMFWWVPSPLRMQIVTRHSLERRALHDTLGHDLIRSCLESSVGDPITSGALSLIRPTRRLAEEDAERMLALLAQERNGEFLDMVGITAHIRPETLLRIIDDKGGEPLAVLGKALGLQRAQFDRFARGASGLRRGPGPTEQDLDAMVELFDTLSRDRAALVLHYWDQTVADDALLGRKEPDRQSPHRF